jgi:hypothetical protein
MIPPLMDKRMNTVELKAETKELLEYIEQLRADLVDAPLEIRQSALDFIDLSPELVRFEFSVTSGSVVTALLKPTQRLLDLGHAIRTRNFDSPAVEHSHDEPLDEQDPLMRLMRRLCEREQKLRSNVEAAAKALAESFCSDCPFRSRQTESMAEMKNYDKLRYERLGFEAKVKAIEADMTSDPLKRELLLEESNLASLRQKQIANRHNLLLYALFICEDGTMGLTIFDVDNTATINLEKDMAKGLVENINHYIRLLK